MMTIEEKAKAYDEALGRAKASYGTGAYDDTTTEFIFPEITETDNKDERIRKFLIDYFGIIKSTLSDDGIWKGFQIEEILAFLEKQKEQKPELPKPHKGDDTNPYDMQASEALEYAIKRGFGVPFNDGEVYVDVRHMTQTIGNIIRWADEHPKEQKPVEPSDDELQRHQDELYDFKVFATKQAKEHHISFVHDFEWNNFCAELLSYFNEKQKPAECLKAERDGWYMCIKDYYRGGKKQCSVGDLVQAKGGMYMMDGEDISEWFRKAYYDEIKTVEWNKATINGEPIPTENHSVNIPLAEWSEEDKKIVETICKEGDLKPSEKRWLKSLPERFNLQPKQEWSEEDEALFELLHQCVCRCINDDRMDYSERYNISKMMIPFIEKLQTLHPQQEWSEDNIKELTKFEVAMLHIGMSFFGSSAGLNPNNTNEVKKQAKLLLELVPKQDWSDEDEYRLADISWAIRNCAYNDKKKKQVHDWFENHLKATHPQPHTVSIKDATKFGNLEYERGVKDGIQHAKNHQWKPSDEQIEALEWMLTTVTIKDGGKGVVLKNLVNDLKKQM